MAPRFCLLCTVLLLSSISSRTTGATFTQGRAQPPFSALGTGDYVWEPEVSPAGPLVIIVSVPEQTLYVYRNGVRIGRSTASTGKPGHSRSYKTNRRFHHSAKRSSLCSDALHGAGDLGWSC